jgi:FMN reductase
MASTLILLGGSLRVPSLSLRLLQTSFALLRDRGVQTELLDVRELDLPMYLPDRTIEAYPAEKQANITRLVDAFRRADAMIWACPTYHGTVSGVFKNALDYAELLAHDPRPYLQGCAVGVITINDTSTLTAMSHCVHELRAWLAPTQIMAKEHAFSEDHELIEERVKKRLARQADELVAFMARHHASE